MWGYFDYMENYYKSQEELIDEHQRKLKNVQEVDWDDEVKELKKHGRRKN